MDATFNLLQLRMAPMEMLASPSPQDWVSRIYDFGPAALLVFVTTVLLAFSSRQLTKNPDKRLHQIIYVSNWILVGVLAVATSVIWVILHVHREAFIRGEITNLPSDFVVSSNLNSEEYSFYVRKEYADSSKGAVRFHWLASSEHRLTGSGTLSIVIYKPLSPTDTKQYNRELALDIDDTFYDQSVTIVYINANTYKLRMPGRPEIQVKTTDLEESGEAVADVNEEVAYAATTLDAASMKGRLESPDPMIRRDARADLAKMGTDALTFIDGVLVDPHSSPALVLGAVSALRLMDNSVPSEKHLSAKALTQISFSTASSDPEIANAATNYVKKRNPASIRLALQQWLNSNQSSGARLNDIALADMDILYNMGIAAKDAYGGKQNQALFATAQNDFEQAWLDRRFAEAADQVYFAKALYGWGLLLADRAVLEKDTHGNKQPKFVEAARAKFREFLNAAEHGHQQYPDASHINHAKAYLANPSLHF